MQIAPNDLYQSLEFDKILHLLAESAAGEPGRVRLLDLPMYEDDIKLEVELRRTEDFRKGLDEGDALSVDTYEPITDDLRMLRVSGYVMPIESLQRIHAILRTVRRVMQYFSDGRSRTYPALYDLTRGITFDEELLKAIDRTVDEEGNIRPDASPELGRIRQKISSKERELDRTFRRLIGEYRKNGWLADTVESLRNGRRVFTVPSEHKRKIKGIIHDESTTGRTAYIEPEPIIDINNDIFDLQTEERREIYRILKDLSETLRPYGDDFEEYQELTIKLDVLQAKALLAKRLRAVRPKLSYRPNLGIKDGRHPLLYLKYQQEGRKVQPFDLVLHGANRLLVLSGPNAGGKSILMKSVGLMQLMLQSGMLLPVDEESEFGMFKKVYADIGDQQSLEDDLSTYSSRLKNMNHFLRNADEDTLILIDEFGSGTDPKIGGAIAEAMLRDLNKIQVYGVITTHYSNLKVFAYKNKGIVNGAMRFDKDSLSPTYELSIGKPGSSYAYEIAQKSGLSKKLLDYARHKTGKNEKAVDELLVSLQREKQELEEKLRQAQLREQQLDKMTKNYERMFGDLDLNRKKLKLNRKELEAQEKAREQKALDRLVRELREKETAEQVKQRAKKVREENRVVQAELETLREQVYETPVRTSKRKARGPLKVGDFVKLRSSGNTGKVESLDRKTATVQVGQLRVTVKTRELIPIDAPLETTGVRVKTDMMEKQAKFENKLDIRGMRYEQALDTVQEFVDAALVANAHELRIVHGKGSGALRKAVRKKLREYPAIGSIHHPADNDGGDGVTVAELE